MNGLDFCLLSLSQIFLHKYMWFQSLEDGHEKMMWRPKMTSNNYVLVCIVAQLCLTRVFATPWTVRLLCPWGFSREEYWSGLPCPPRGDLPKPGMEPRSATWQVDSLPFEPLVKPSYNYKQFKATSTVFFWKDKRRP